MWALSQRNSLMRDFPGISSGHRYGRKKCQGRVDNLGVKAVVDGLGI